MAILFVNQGGSDAETPADLPADVVQAEKGSLDEITSSVALADLSSPESVQQEHAANCC